MYSNILLEIEQDDFFQPIFQKRLSEMTQSFIIKKNCVNNQEIYYICKTFVVT